MSNEHPASRQKQDARREAADWFVVMHETTDPSPDVLQKWLAWLDASEENQRAFEETVAVWHDALPELAAADADVVANDDYDGSLSIAEWRTKHTGFGAEPTPAATPARWRKPLLAFAAAAGIAAITAVAMLELVPYFRSAPISAGEFATHTAEHLDLLLEDGSRVTLGARSRLRVDFSPAVRQLRLDAGEAFFTVRKDARRPFTVLTLDSAITAVGTSFDVRAVADRVTVSVTEGVVRVTEMGEGSATPGAVVDLPEEGRGSDSVGTSIRVERGQQFTLNSGKTGPGALAMPALQHVDPSESARWREGRFVYRREPLRYVVADIARYTDLQLTVADSVADLPFTGVVFRDRIPEWFAALPEVIAVAIESEGSRLSIVPPSTAASARH